MRRRENLWHVLLAVVLCMAFHPACGGGGGSVPAPADNAETLHWVQPPLYADNTPLDLRTGVHAYEIHLSDNCDFQDNTAVAAVGGVSDVGDPIQNFDLSLLGKYGIQPGPLGTFLSIRSVGIDNAASGFGEPAFWEAR